jgi:protein-tyrosine kinase
MNTPESKTGNNVRPIGALLIEAGRLSPEGSERTLKQQQERGAKFGETAVQLGLVSQADVAQALAKQYGYAYLTPGDSRLSPSLVCAFEPNSLMAEQMRALRSQLQARWFQAQPGHKTLALCSSARGEGRSYIAANLAVAFSQLGLKTLLIDADLRHPSQHERFKANNQTGLSSLIAGRSDLVSSIKPIPGLPGLDLLTAGPEAPNPQELLGQSRFTELLDQLAQHYSIILLDTAAAADNSDALTLAHTAKGALLIARQDHTLVSQLKQFQQQLAQTGASLVGSFLNQG